MAVVRHRWWRRRILWWTLVAVALLVLVYGRGFLPGTLHSGSVEGATAGAATALSSGGADANTKAAPLPSTAVPDSAGVAPSTALVAGAAANDRLGLLASAVENAILQERPALAAHALQMSRDYATRQNMVLDPALVEQVQSCVLRACQKLVAAIGEGEIGAAERLLDTLLLPAEPAIDAALLALSAEHGWPAVHSLVSSALAVEVGDTIRSDRAVRWWSAAGTVLRMRVVRVDGARATLRLISARGVTFPSVPVYLLEPLSPSADEAAGLGLAALMAGEVRRARLFCACSVARDGSPRTQRLLSLLP